MTMSAPSLTLVTKYVQLLLGAAVAVVAVIKLPERGRPQLEVSWQLVPLAVLLAAAWTLRSNKAASNVIALIGNFVIVALVAWQLFATAQVGRVEPLLVIAFIALVVSAILSSRALVRELRRCTSV